ncbi:hypothetical protein D3C75_1140940 [compost metagenome]
MADLVEFAHAHVHHKGGATLGERLPVQRAVILGVCGDQGHAPAYAAQGQGNAALGCPGKAGGNAVDQFSFDTLGL